MELQVGSILEGKVTTITKFGAFVALEGGKSGLVHISEIANAFVNDVHDFVQEGRPLRCWSCQQRTERSISPSKRRSPRSVQLPGPLAPQAETLRPGPVVAFSLALRSKTGPIL